MSDLWFVITTLVFLQTYFTIIHLNFNTARIVKDEKFQVSAANVDDFNFAISSFGLFWLKQKEVEDNDRYRIRWTRVKVEDGSNKRLLLCCPPRWRHWCGP